LQHAFEVATTKKKTFSLEDIFNTKAKVLHLKKKLR
jgi:hypothetical protein